MEEVVLEAVAVVVRVRVTHHHAFCATFACLARISLPDEFWSDMTPVLDYMKTHMPDDGVVVPSDISFPSVNYPWTHVTFTVTEASNKKKDKVHVKWHVDSENAEGSMAQSLAIMDDDGASDTHGGLHFCEDGLLGTKEHPIPNGEIHRAARGGAPVPGQRVGPGEARLGAAAAGPQQAGGKPR